MTALSISLNITVSDSITITVTGQVTGQMCLARVDKHSITTLKSLKHHLLTKLKRTCGHASCKLSACHETSSLRGSSKKRFPQSMHDTSAGSSHL